MQHNMLLIALDTVFLYNTAMALIRYYLTTNLLLGSS